MPVNNNGNASTDARLELSDAVVSVTSLSTTSHLTSAFACWNPESVEVAEVDDMARCMLEKGSARMRGSESVLVTERRGSNRNTISAYG